MKLPKVEDLYGKLRWEYCEFNRRIAEEEGSHFYYLVYCNDACIGEVYPPYYTLDETDNMNYHIGGVGWGKAYHSKEEAGRQLLKDNYPKFVEMVNEWLPTPNTAPTILRKLADYAEKQGQSDHMDAELDVFLDSLAQDDYFGTEGQCDPRGDRRDRW